MYNKIYLFVAILALLSVVSLGADYDNKCGREVAAGDKCDGMYMTCPTDYYCPYMVNVTKVCTPEIKDGDACVNGEGCVYPSSCVNKVCTQRYFAGIDEKCSTQDDCSRSLTCTDQVCKAVNYPSCIDTKKHTDCKSTEYCSDDSNKCETLIPIFGNCTDDLQCERQLTCIDRTEGGDGYCRYPFTIPEGFKCSEDTDCDISQDLVCSNGYCHKYVKTSSSVDCNQRNASCINDYELCMCEGSGTEVKVPEVGQCYTGFKFTTDCADTRLLWGECLAKSECPNAQCDSCSKSCKAQKCPSKAYFDACFVSNVSFATKLSFNIVLIAIVGLVASLF
eukprot:gene19063-22828_t